MKDIDFDELDRAVSSLMGSVPKDNSVKKDEVSETTDTETIPTADTIQPESVTPEATSPSMEAEPEGSMSSSFTVGENNENDEAEKVDDSVPVASETPPASPAVPSRGRFMDMVRPSSRDTSRPFSSTPPSRQGVTLQPRSSQFGVTTESTDTKQQTEGAGSSTEEITTEAPDFSSFSLDLSEPMEDTTTSTSETVQPEPIEESLPLSSPFLADAKVEKRPLGRPVDTPLLVDSADFQADNTDAVPNTTEVVEESVTRDKDAQLPEQPLPAELDSTLLSIETNSVGVSHDSPLADPMRTEAVNAVPVKPETAAPTVPSATETTASTPDPIRTITSTSIPQQYKIQTAVSEETPVGAIYDSQPLMHPADKKPGWQLIVAILAILILGAAGGAAVYYLGLL